MERAQDEHGLRRLLGDDALCISFGNPGPRTAQEIGKISVVPHEPRPEKPIRGGQMKTELWKVIDQIPVLLQALPGDPREPGMQAVIEQWNIAVGENCGFPFEIFIEGPVYS